MAHCPSATVGVACWVVAQGTTEVRCLRLATKDRSPSELSPGTHCSLTIRLISKRLRCCQEPAESVTELLRSRSRRSVVPTQGSHTGKQGVAWLSVSMIAQGAVKRS